MDWGTGLRWGTRPFSSCYPHSILRRGFHPTLCCHDLEWNHGGRRPEVHWNRRSDIHGPGIRKSMGSVSVQEFTGSHTQTIYDNHSITGQGQFSGKGTFDGSITGDFPSCSGDSVPDGSEACLVSEDNYRLNRTITALESSLHSVSANSQDLFQATFIGSTRSSQTLTKIYPRTGQ